MKKCPQCNAKYDDHIKKCSACGTLLVDIYDNIRRCKRCGRELGADEIVCRACEEEKNLKLSTIKDEIQYTEESNEPSDTDYRHHDKDARRGKEKIAPKSLEGLSSLSVIFRLVDVFFTLLGVFSAYMYYRSTEDVFIALVIGIIIVSLGFFYMMISTLFQALHDIVRGIYHIANK